VLDTPAAVGKGSEGETGKGIGELDLEWELKTPERGIPGQWDTGPYSSLDASPISGLTEPRRDLITEVLGAVKDELTIGFIANEIPMEPELSPEPEVGESRAATIQYDEEKEAEMLRQVAEDSKKQGEADLRKEEEEVFERVVEAAKWKKGERGETSTHRKEGESKARAEPAGRSVRGEEGIVEKVTGKMREGGLGRETGKEEEKRIKGLCDLCKESERGRGEEDSREKKIESSDWGEEWWREAGITVVAEEAKGEDKVLIRGPRQEAGVETRGGGKSEKREDSILVNAPKGPKQMPHLCNLCKLYEHSDLTCFKQGNAPTPGPSRYQKPFKHVQQRTPRRGLGATQGSNGQGTGKKPGSEVDGEKRKIVFERGKESESSAEGKTKLGEPRLKVDSKANADPEPRPETVTDRGKVELKAKKGEGKGKGKERQTDKEVISIHLGDCRAPRTGNGAQEKEWKRLYRARIEVALKKVAPEATVLVLGISYHFSRRNEKVVTVQVENWLPRNQVRAVVLGAVSKIERNWTITAMEMGGWREVIVENVDGRERGALARTRAEEIAQANGWKLAPRAPQWAGQRRNFDTYEGEPTGLIMTLIRREGEPPARDCVDSTYISFGKNMVGKLKVYPLSRDGNHNFYVNEEGYKVSSRTSEHGPYVPPQWSPYKGKDNCVDCGDWRHKRCGQNRRLPICNLCNGLHLDRECLRGRESLADLKKRREEVERLVEEEEKRLGRFETVEEEIDNRYPKGRPQNQKKHHDQKEPLGNQNGSRAPPPPPEC